VSETAAATIDTAEPSSGPAWKPLAWLMSRSAYGDLLAHESIAGVLGVAHGTNPYYGIVKTAIEEEQKRKRHWRLVSQKGYQLLFPHEIHQLSADHVGKAKASMTRGAVVLQRRDTAQVPRLIDKSYASAEVALTAMTELLSHIEREMRVTGAPERFAQLKAIAEKAREQWREDMQFKPTTQIVNGVQKHITGWRPFRCPCGVVLVQFQSISKHNKKAIAMTCARCGNKNMLFGVGENTGINVVFGNVVEMVDA
jgi:hypothetical protein